MVVRTLLAMALASVAAAQELSDLEGRLAALEIQAAEHTAREAPPAAPRHFYGDVQFMFLRAESGLDLADQYKLAPRAVLGFEQAAGLRLRYWQYDYLLPSGQPDDHLDAMYYYNFQAFNVQARRFDFRAVDFELTGSIERQHTAARISGGIRWTSIDLDFVRKYTLYMHYLGIDADDDVGPPQYFQDTRETGIELFGPTVAADGRTRLWRGLSGVYGGRISVMGGDWAGDPLWFGKPAHDTFFVPEIYSGLEYQYGPMFARVVYEYQLWQSDLLDDYNSTVSFDGLGCHLGFIY